MTKKSPTKPTPKKARGTVAQSLIASAEVFRTEARTRRERAGSTPWSNEAFGFYDEVGELHFAANTFAARCGSASIYIGKKSDDAEDGSQAPERIDLDDEAAAPLRSLLENPALLSAVITRATLQIFVVGVSHIVGVPRDWIEASGNAQQYYVPDSYTTDVVPDDLVWGAVSESEISRQSIGSRITINFRGIEFKNVNPDSIVDVAPWRPHPNDWNRADSPVMAAMPILREIVALTKHVGAQADSRLAGAGLLLIPDDIKAGTDAATGEYDDGDELTEAMIEAMMEPINDRASAAAIVPLILTGNGDSIEKVKHITFSTPFDKATKELREEAIRRLAISLDHPPELLLGQAEANHWSAWLVQEDTVRSHIEPMLALIANALTEQLLHPMLEQLGTEDWRSYSVWYDTTNLVKRSNRLDDASVVYESGELSGEALRESAGFGESDAPEKNSTESLSVEMTVKMLLGKPELAVDPGWQVIYDNNKALLDMAPLPNRPGADAVEVTGTKSRSSGASKQEAPAS